MIMRLLRWALPQENETECVKCNHRGSCSAGLVNCATYSPMVKRSVFSPVMSFGPRMKKYSRPVFDPSQSIPAPAWHYIAWFVIFVGFVAFVATAEVAK